MKIRVFSDLHLDVNNGFPLSLLKKDKDAFTIIAGDVAGITQVGIDWIKDNVSNGICIAGNHLVYNDYNRSIKDLKEWLKIEFPKNESLTFLDNDYKQIDDNTIVIGSTLYTNYEINNASQKDCMIYTKRRLNDFRFGLTEDDNENESLRPIEPSDYLKMFNESFDFIKKICEENSDKNIIVVTHHGPSFQSIAHQYYGDILNGAYVSDLEDFIKTHNNIKCWIHGHMHNQFDYMIGQCRVLCNPRGYCRNLEDTNWNPMTYIDTDTWEVSSDDSWFNREQSEEEIVNRKKLQDYYNALFSMYGI